MKEAEKWLIRKSTINTHLINQKNYRNVKKEQRLLST